MGIYGVNGLFLSFAVGNRITVTVSRSSVTGIGRWPKCGPFGFEHQPCVGRGVVRERVLIMNIPHDDWRHGGPWWLIRCLGRYLLAFLVSAPVLGLVLPAKDVAGEGGGSTYWQGVGAAILMTWLLLAVVGVWTVIVLLVIVGFRSRMEVASFRLLAGVLLFLPLFAIPMVGGFSATLIYFCVHLLFVTVLMPVAPGASTSALS